MELTKTCDQCLSRHPGGYRCDASIDGSRCGKTCKDSDGFIKGALIGEWDDQTIIMDLCKEDFEKALKFLGQSSRIEYRSTSV